MAKAGTKVKPLPTVAAPDRLTMSLFAPGMTPLHRAGLGGLACTLKYIERAYRTGALTDDDVPGGPWHSGQAPWAVESHSIALQFGEAGAAREYLRRLFSLAFPIKDGLIQTPGVYPGLTPPLAVQAELQNGLTLSFLQHGKTRDLQKSPTVVEFDPDGGGHAILRLEYKRCGWFKHQDGWEGLTDEKSGTLTKKGVEVIGPLNPGAVVRHVAFAAATRIENRPEYVLPLYFSIVGCFALPINRGVGVLIVPEVNNLPTFVRDRPVMTPTCARDCRIAGTSDAVLQTATRLRSRGYLQVSSLPGCLGVRFQPTSWASQQKSRVDAIHSGLEDVVRFEPGEESTENKRLDQFETVLALLPARIVSRRRDVTDRVSADGSAEREESFWIDSLVRPLIAENLARRRRWYDCFSRLGRSQDNFAKVGFEQKGLQVMTETDTLINDDELRFIRVIHRAIFMSLGRIYADTVGPEDAKRRVPATQAVKNRWKRFKERLRLDLAGAKTPSQIQHAVNELLIRSGVNKDLHDPTALRDVKNLLFGRDWQRALNLTMFAVASYKRPVDQPQLPGEDEAFANE